MSRTRRNNHRELVSIRKEWSRAKRSDQRCGNVAIFKFYEDAINATIRFKQNIEKKMQAEHYPGKKYGIWKSTVNSESTSPESGCSEQPAPQP